MIDVGMRECTLLSNWECANHEMERRIFNEYNSSAPGTKHGEEVGIRNLS